MQLKRWPTKEQLWHSCCNKTNYNSQRIFKLFPSYLHYTEQLKRYWLHMSKAKMNFNRSVMYSLSTILSQLELLDFRPKNPQCATALCQIFSFATLKDLNDIILQTSSNLYCAYRDGTFIHSFSYQNLSSTSLAVLLTVVLQYEVSPATLLTPNTSGSW